MANNFGTRQNNDRGNTPNVNTRSYQFKNRDGFDPSALSVGGWNDMLSFRINPALEKSKQTNDQIFDYEKFVATSLTMEKATLLLYKIQKEIIPAIDAGTTKVVGIPINGGESLLIVGTGDKTTDKHGVYFGIHKALNETTKKPEMSMYYEFRQAQTVDDYDEKTGGYTLVEGIQSEFKLFIELLKAFIVNCSNFGTHSSRVINRYNNEKLNANIVAIGEKIGANVTGSGSYTKGFSGSHRNVFGGSNTSKTSDTNDNSEPSELTDIEDLNSFINE